MTDIAHQNSDPIPRVCLVYGLLGLIPFLAPPVAALVWPVSASFAGQTLAVYGGLILSFLGGGRWGLAILERRPNIRIIGLSMLPTLAALALLLAPPSARAFQLCGLAAALAADGVWDVRASQAPAWYPRLRGLLTGGAVTGLLLGAAFIHG